MSEHDRADSAGRPAWRVVVDLGIVLLLIALVGYRASRPTSREDGRAPAGEPVGPGVAMPLEDPAAVEIPSPEPTPKPEPAEIAEAGGEGEVEALPLPAPEPEPDHEAIARAEAERDAARRAREAAERRLAEEEDRLRRAELDGAQAALASRTLAERIRDPRARIATAQTRGAVLKSERERLEAELTSLARAPRPRRKVLSDRTPVARTVEGDEFHFEVRGDRVAFIDLERLVKKLEADARLQIRLSRGAEPRIQSTVGPVGDFSLRYVLGSAMPGSVDALIGLSVSYDLIGWEIVPERPTRGETLSALGHPASVFAQVLNSLNPGRETITLWVYPDGFHTYRELKALLHARGFEVAARPLPEGVPIRGSPNGSLSAGQ